MSVYKPKFFRAYELVDPQTFYKFGEEKSWWFITEKVCRFIELMRNTYGKIIINDWMWGGDYKWSGFRTPDSRWYSYWSQHSLGNAVDMKFQDLTAEEVRQDLRERWSSFDMFPITVEKNISWSHVDFRPQINMYNEF